MHDESAICIVDKPRPTVVLTMGLQILKIQNDFIPCLSLKLDADTASKSSLQSLIDCTIQGLRKQDQIVRNGGKGVIKAMIGVFCHSPLIELFQDMSDYLAYRGMNAATA
jgi:hypothetical protein